MARRFAPLLLALTAGITLSGCLHDTPTPPTLDRQVTIVVRGDPNQNLIASYLAPGALPGQTTPIGTVNAGQTVSSTPFHGRIGDSVEILGDLPNSANVFDQRFPVPNSDGPNATLQVNLSAEGAPALPVAEAQQKLRESFSHLGKVRGFAPSSLVGAISGLFGGIVVMQPVDNDHPVATFYDTITPVELKVGDVTAAYDKVESLPFSVYTTAYDVKFDTTTAANLGATLPVIASLGFDLNTQTAFEMNYQLVNAGQILYGKPNFDIGKAIAQLSAERLSYFCKNAEAHKDAVIVRVTRLWGFQSATFTTKQASKLAAGAKLTGNSFVSGGVAYSFDQSVESHETYLPSYVNADGDEIQRSTICPAQQEYGLHLHTESIDAKRLFTGRKIVVPLNARGAHIPRSKRYTTSVPPIGT